MRPARLLLRGLAVAIASGATASVLMAAGQTPAATPAAPAVTATASARPATSRAAAPRVVANTKTAIVKTAYGQVRGFIHDGIYNYKGIQYAKAERFMPPESPESWEGVRTALSDLKVCPINRPNLLPDEMEFAQQHRWGFETEDCLRLNVWTPGINDGKKRPVMVWLHGGGYSGGSSIELPFYDGENLARTGDVVVVSVNHRLNVLGFLDLSAYDPKYAASGNVGISDLVAALKWVNGSIAGFGGDPGNVMIFGQSGGGGKVTTLLSSPSAKGLFHKAAVQSGSLTTFLDQQTKRDIAAELLSTLGIQPSQVDELQKMPYEKLWPAARAASQKVREKKQATGVTGLLDWAPGVDGALLPYQGDDPRAIEISKHVPVIIGSNKTEFNRFAADPLLREGTEQSIDQWLTKQYGEKKDAYVAAVRKAYPDRLRPADLVDIDMMFRPGVIKQATGRAKAGAAPVYVYLFKWNAPVLDGMFKSMHCLEIPFVFNSVDFAQQHTGGGPEAYALATKVSRAWTQFAHTGNPNHSGVGLPNWPAFTAEGGATMMIDDKSEARPHPDAELAKVLGW